jgi:hypothetical protein
MCEVIRASAISMALTNTAIGCRRSVEQVLVKVPARRLAALFRKGTIKRICVYIHHGCLGEHRESQAVVQLAELADLLTNQPRGGLAQAVDSAV